MMQRAISPSNKRKGFVIASAMTKYVKPGSIPNWDYPQMVKEAGTKAIQMSKIELPQIEQAVVGYVYGDSTSGQRAVYELGLYGIPIYNTNNNCSTGSSALMLAKQLVEGGIANCTIAVGFEKMQRGSLDLSSKDRTSPLDKHVEALAKFEGKPLEKAPLAPLMFALAGREHMRKFGTPKEVFAKIAVKNHKHSVHNEFAQFRDEYTLEQVLASKMIAEPLTMLQCSPTSDGAAAAILASEEFVKAHNLQDQAVEIMGQAMATDLPSSFTDGAIRCVGYDMTKKAADAAFKQAGISRNDIQAVELHDCFSTNELITYEALGLTEEGKGARLIEDGNATYGGKYVINPSGGLESRGHALGATGIAQCTELYTQLLGKAGVRQVPNCEIVLQHNLGLGGAAVVSIYRRAQI